ncbi:glycosyltransferase family A protein [Salinibacterium sp. M195]|uniref:glycosyltransferase family A protein n=1 Tax=Salinibacterium sp. M195 TaxID=2583374 RepID=UPI001C62A091|nr:glycosyltransferase family A protein [Salinibacterium sp. M195]
MPPEHPPAPTLLSLFDMFLDRDAADPAFTDHLRAARDQLQVSLLGETSDPFLSVVLTTNGGRLEVLSDALLCLAAQTARDFEVIVVARDSVDDNRAQISALVDDYRPLLPNARVVDVTGASRALSLNAGVQKAQGRYLAFVDDSDLLFAHWVETFHNEAQSHSGRLVRAVAGTQDISSERWADGRDGFRALTWSKAAMAADQGPVHDVVSNLSPLTSIAFPSALFTTLGFRFDETLTTGEGREIIARGASILGIVSALEFTSIHRRWAHDASASDEQARTQQQTAGQQLVARLDAEPTLLPAGAVSHLRSLVTDKNASIALRHVLASKSWRFFGPLRAVVSNASNLRARALARVRRRRSS